VRGGPTPSELLHGAQDDGHEVVVNPKVEPAMQKIALSYRLAAHEVRDTQQRSTRVLTSADLKALVGGDRRNYLLETMRIFPVDANFIDTLWPAAPAPAPAPAQEGADGPAAPAPAPAPVPAGPTAPELGAALPVRAADGTGDVADAPAYPHRIVLLRPELVSAWYEHAMVAETRKVLEERKAAAAAAAAEGGDAAAAGGEGDGAAKEGGDGADASAVATAAAAGNLSLSEIEGRLHLWLNPDLFVSERTTPADALTTKDGQASVEAARFLLETVVPALADDLAAAVAGPVDSAGLVDLMHARGINMRYLGALARAVEARADNNPRAQLALVRARGFWRRLGCIAAQALTLTCALLPLRDDAQDLIRAEMVGRAAKAILRQRLREVPQTSRPLLPVVAAHVLNAYLAEVPYAPRTTAAKAAQPNGGAAPAAARKKDSSAKGRANGTTTSVATAEAPAARSGSSKGKPKHKRAGTAKAVAEGATGTVVKDMPLDPELGFVPALPAELTAGLTSELLWADIVRLVRERFRYDLPAAWRSGVTAPLRRLQALRVLCKAVGLQVLARTYRFDASEGCVFTASDIVGLVPVAEHAYGVVRWGWCRRTWLRTPAHSLRRGRAPRGGPGGLQVEDALSIYDAGRNHLSKGASPLRSVHGCSARVLRNQALPQAGCALPTGDLATAREFVLEALIVMQQVAGLVHPDTATMFQCVPAELGRRGTCARQWLTAPGCGWRAGRRRCPARWPPSRTTPTTTPRRSRTRRWPSCSQSARWAWTTWTPSSTTYAPVPRAECSAQQADDRARWLLPPCFFFLFSFRRCWARLCAPTAPRRAPCGTWHVRGTCSRSCTAPGTTRKWPTPRYHDTPMARHRRRGLVR